MIILFIVYISLFFRGPVFSCYNFRGLVQIGRIHTLRLTEHCHSPICYTTVGHSSLLSGAVLRKSLIEFYGFYKWRYNVQNITQYPKHNSVRHVNIVLLVIIYSN